MNNNERLSAPLSAVRTAQTFLHTIALTVSLLLPANSAQALTIDEAVAQALDSNPVLRVRRVSLERAVSAVDVGPGWLAPSIEAEASPVTFQNGYEAEIGLAQKLRPSGRSAAEKRLALAVASRQSYQVAALELSVTLQTRRLYRTVGLQEERIHILTDLWEREDRLLRVAQSRKPFGEVSDLDMGQLKSRATSRWADLEETLGALDAGRIALASWIGRADTSGLAVSAVVPAPLLPVDSLVSALDFRPDIRAFRAEVDEAQAEIDVAGTGNLGEPEFGLYLKKTGGNDSENHVGARISIPLPFLNSVTRPAAVAEARRDAATELQGAERNLAELNLRASLARVEAARRGFAAYDMETRGAIKRALELAERAYADGRIDVFALTEVARASVDIELNRIAALGRWHESLNEAEEFAGRGLTPGENR